MFVFVCAGCGTELTAPLSQVALPVHAHQVYGNGVRLPALMEPGTFAVHPEPWGPPWRTWEEVGPDGAAARGVHGPVHALSDGAPGAIVLAPGDVRGTLLVPGKGGAGACCGLNGGDGPNMTCAGCGLPVATRIDDCSLWQAVWLAPNAADRLPADGTDAEPLSWEELTEEGKGTPPIEPIAVRVPGGSRLGRDHYWSWSPQWEAAAGRALAHLLAASEGQPVTVPDGLPAEVFQRALDALLPTGPEERHAALAGPGLPGPGTDADILLVPVHPQTGRTWTPGEPAGPAASAYPVPLPFGVWLWLAFPQPYVPVPASGGLPDDVLRDDPLPPLPHHPFDPDLGTLRHALARLSAVRSPWLREVHENLMRHNRTTLF